MSNSHTHGPWTTRGGLVLVGDESNSGNVIAEVRTGGKGGLSLSSKAIEANARLISAAPDLLAALQALLAVVKNEGVLQGQKFDGLGIQVLAAIAKAKGVA